MSDKIWRLILKIGSKCGCSPKKGSPRVTYLVAVAGNILFLSLVVIMAAGFVIGTYSLAHITVLQHLFDLEIIEMRRTHDDFHLVMGYLIAGIVDFILLIKLYIFLSRKFSSPVDELDVALYKEYSGETKKV